MRGRKPKHPLQHLVRLPSLSGKRERVSARPQDIDRIGIEGQGAPCMGQRLIVISHEREPDGAKTLTEIVARTQRYRQASRLQQISGVRLIFRPAGHQIDNVGICEVLISCDALWVDLQSAGGASDGGAVCIPRCAILPRAAAKL